MMGNYYSTAIVAPVTLNALTWWGKISGFYFFVCFLWVIISVFVFFSVVSTQNNFLF